MMMLQALRESAKSSEVCQKYVDAACKSLAPLQKSAERLFGKDSVFTSSSGQGSETKLYKTMMALLSNPGIAADTPLLSDIDIEDVWEQIQEYVWTNPIDDLDPLGHHYDVEDVADFRIEETRKEGNTLWMETTFGLDVTLYIDNEEDSGFAMLFPTVCEAAFEKMARKYLLVQDSVNVSVNTEDYYR